MTKLTWKAPNGSFNINIETLRHTLSLKIASCIIHLILCILNRTFDVKVSGFLASLLFSGRFISFFRKLGFIIFMWFNWLCQALIVGVAVVSVFLRLPFCILVIHQINCLDPCQKSKVKYTG